MTSTDIKIQQKLGYLRRLLDLRVRLLMKYVESVDVWVEKEMVYVKWISKKGLDNEYRDKMISSDEFKVRFLELCEIYDEGFDIALKRYGESK